VKTFLAFVSLALLGWVGIWTRNASVTAAQQSVNSRQAKGDIKSSIAENQAVAVAVEKGARWLASVQGTDGGWGQDGGNSNVRQDVRLESTGNDIANTALAALALLRAGDKYRPNVERAVDFVVGRVERSPVDGLAIRDVKQETQVQRKLGPFIDTFVASMLLARVDGTFANSANVRIRSALEKCVAKIERNQMADGSWNFAGGWAPVLGTSLASRSLYEAGKKGVAVSRDVMTRADAYTLNARKDTPSTTGAGAGVVRHFAGGGTPLSASGQVPLYHDAQALEQLSRTPESRRQNAKEIAAINKKLSDSTFVEGYGSMGGEEFFSYLNVSDSLKRSGGREWAEWKSKITQKILKLQNDDGTWAGHHCITGRCAVTSAAILNLISDRVD
jgi:hypothetical protein